MSDADLQALATQQEVSAPAPAAPQADPSQLSDTQLLGTAIAQKQISPDDAQKALVAKKQSDRAPIADALASVISSVSPEVPEALAKEILTGGGKVGDAAANVITPILGGIIGSAVEPGGGTAAGGAAGGAAGNALAQTREYLRGERDDVSLGQLTANTLAGGIPVGRPALAGIGTMVARRALQGAGIGTGTAAIGQLIDNGKLDFTSLAESGGLGALFGGTVGGVEGIAAQKLALGALRATPEFRDFDGTDAELIAAAKAKMATLAPQEKNVTGTGEAPEAPAGQPDITKVPDAELQAMAAKPPETPSVEMAQPAGAIVETKDTLPNTQPSEAAPSPATEITGTPQTYGIAQRVADAHAAAGIIPPIEPGSGASPEELVAQGQAELEKGAEPIAAMQRFADTRSINAADIALVRARGEELFNAAAEAGDQYGVDSPQYKVAAEADFAWRQQIKPMQTEWAKAGAAQQGETEIDTGTFHGLHSGFMDLTGGRDFTPDQVVKAQAVADNVKAASDNADLAKQKVLDAIAEQGKANPSQVWQLAKQYLDDGSTDYDDVVHSIAADTGMPVDEVRTQLTQPKGMGPITNDMYAKLSNRRQMIANAKNWVQNEATPGWLRFLKGVPRVFFLNKVFGHGTVGMITHAGLNIFNPTAWDTYWPNFMRQFKLIGWHDRGAFHEQMMQNLVRDPNFVTARRAGLANDPIRITDDYQQAPLIGWLGRLGLSGNKGFDALKLFRQDRFNTIWDGLPLSLKNPDMAKLIADAINHATGVIQSKLPGAANVGFFAPKLELSRWAFEMVDPAKASKVLLNWNNETPEAKASALSAIKQLATVTATYFGLLAINQGLLSAAGSKQKINFTNPRSPDFLSFKALGYRFSVVSPMIGMVSLFADLLHDSMGTRTPFEQTESRSDEMGRGVWKYMRQKLSPIAGDVLDVASQADYSGRPLPFNNEKVPAKFSRDGVGRYTYPEYLSETYTPIPVSEAIKEVWGKAGASQADMNKWAGALMTGLLAGGTGARMTPDEARPNPGPPLHHGSGRN
jgi:hypothetical protein